MKNCPNEAQRGAGQPGSMSVENEQLIQLMKENQLPVESISDTEVLATGTDAATDLALKRGQYRVKGWVPANDYESYDKFERDIMKAVKQDRENKRVHFHKIDVGEREKIVRDGGEFKAHPFTLVFTVIDNPLPLAPIIWGASIIGSSTAGWFLVDKVEGFTESSTGSFLSIAAALATLGGLYFTLMK